MDPYFPMNYEYQDGGAPQLESKFAFTSSSGKGGSNRNSLFSKVQVETESGETNGSEKTSRDSTPVPAMTYQQQMWMDQENMGGTTFYYAEESQQEIPEESSEPAVFPPYAVFAGTPSYLKDYLARTANTTGSNSGTIVHPNPAAHNTSFFAGEDIRMEILHKNTVALSQPNTTLHPDLPTQVDHYHELCPLESTGQKSSTFSYPTTCYKAINSKNGFTYCLRRIHGFRLPSGKWLGLVESWKQLSHCNIVQLREIFTTKAFGDNSLIFVYDYFPTAETLMARHFDRNNQANGYVDPFTASDPAVARPYSHIKTALLRHHANMLPENLLWAYVVQLSSVIRTIHSAGLAVRSLDPTKILLTSRTRPSIRLNCCGICDIVTFDPSASPAQLTPFHQQEDLLALGKLLMVVACNSLLAVQRENLNASLDMISKTYSSDLRNLVVYLMNPRGTGTRSINDIMPMIGARFYNQLDAANSRAEVLENCLSREIENGRLFRLLVKLSTVVERHELNMDPAWSETGDRYLLKLFRDYVFHQINADGRPWLDMSHVVFCLNRLDAGAPDKVCLMSRDEQSVLITTYAELKQCLEQSFGEIAATAATSPQKTHTTSGTNAAASSAGHNHIGH